MKREIKFRAFHDKEKCFWYFELFELRNKKIKQTYFKYVLLESIK